MKKEILELLAQFAEFDIDNLLELSEHTKLTEIGLDSLQFVQFIVALEEKYGFEVTDSDLLVSNFETIGNLMNTLNKYFEGNMSLKKVLICDCDDCLWHGVAGEEVIYMDSASICLQNKLVELYNKGVLICLCSKNQPENIQKIFRESSMPLNEGHILISKVNYNNKSDNISEIATELNLSLDSFVYIDNSDYEIGFINLIMPEVTTIRVDYSQNINTLISKLNFFFSYMSVDNSRTQQYREQKLREKEKNNHITVEEYNEFLDTSYICEQASLEQAERIAELSQRTNQFNLSNTRYSNRDVCNLILDNVHLVVMLEAKDKYGDMGVIGAAIVRIDKENIIEAFFLSCRVFGRKFEDIIINKIKDCIKGDLIGIYYETAKNKRFKKFYLENGVKIYEK